MSNTEIVHRDFGNENIDFLTLEEIKRLDGRSKIQDTLKFIHFNPEHPENFNIRLTEQLLSEKTIEIRENGEWVKKDIDLTMPIIEKSIREKIKRKYFLEEKLELQIKKQLREFLKIKKR